MICHKLFATTLEVVVELGGLAFLQVPTQRPQWNPRIAPRSCLVRKTHLGFGVSWSVNL